MGGVLARVLYALVLAGVLATATWISFSRFVAGRSTRVPDLTSLSVEEATARAAEIGLAAVVDPGKDDYDEKVPVRRVRAQEPAPETAVKEGQTVRLFLSLGPKTLRMPDLTGQSPRAAAAALVRQGLPEPALAAVRLPESAGVVAQSASPGSVVPPGSAVALLVNRGPADAAWVMPDLIGRDVERVRTAFEARGFRVGSVKSQAYEGAPGGTILRQVPPAGFPVSRKDVLSFVVASAEGPS
ncbi:MAG TPA: PASTA domain-containing protein [Thermoanaerobaculia bacterium]|nr:PASTA domain-containing protein [Thermoanaerobaculia bacterium]